MNTFIFMFRVFNTAILYVFGHILGSYVVSCFYVYDKHQRHINYVPEKPKTTEEKFQQKYKGVVIRKKYFEDHFDSSDETSDESDCSSIELYDKPASEDDYPEFFKDKSVEIEHETYKDMHMMWDPTNNQFIYYCRTREIPYKVLDVLCRKFVLTYDLCDKYVINFHHEQMEELEEMKNNDQDNAYDGEDEDDGELISNDCDDFEDISKDEDENPKPNSVFSMLKKTEERKLNQEKYNKNINVFKYGGNIFDFEKRLSNNTNIEKNARNINYMQFKFEKDQNLKMD